MDYARLLRRPFDIVLQNPYLLLLGLLIALAGGTGGGGGGTNYQTSTQDIERAFGSGFADQVDAWAGVAIAAIVGLICVALVVYLLIWAASQVAVGGLVSAVDSIEDNRPSSLGLAWRAGWSRKWTLIGIGLVLLIPILLLAMLFAGGILVFVGGTLGGEPASLGNLFVGTSLAVLIALACLFVPIMLILGLLSEFAYRACMLEGTGVVDSYKRGWHVLFANLGPATILILIRIGIGIVLLIPTFIGSLCCLLWPLLLALGAAVTTYFSAVWTLAWREWTGRSKPDATSPAIEPA